VILRVGKNKILYILSLLTHMEISEIIKQSNQVRRVQYKIGKEFITFIHDPSKSWCWLVRVDKQLELYSDVDVMEVVYGDKSIKIEGQGFRMKFEFEDVYVKDNDIIFHIKGVDRFFKLTNEGIKLVVE